MHPGSLARASFFIVTSLVATFASAQVVWQGTDSNWFTGTNWSGGAVPSNTRASVSANGSTNTVTTNGAASSVSLAGLDVASSTAQLVFDFASTGYTLNLGTASSTWSAGLVDLRNSSGIYGNGTANTTLTIASGAELRYSTNNVTRNLYNLTVSNSGTIHNVTGTLSITYADLTNQSGALIHADGTEIDIGNSTTLNNLGTIRATGANGKVFFYDSLTSANLGFVDLVNGGQAYLGSGSTLDNTGTTLAAPNGGSFQLYGGTIKNGSLSAGAVTFTNYGGTLNNVSLLDNLALGSGTNVSVTGGANFTGANATLGNNATVDWKQAGTLAGKSISMSPGSLIYVMGANDTLTLDSATNVSGAVQIYSDGNTGTAVTNQGTLTHNVASTGYLYANTFANAGTITNSSVNTTLVIGNTSSGYNTTNTGTITVNGSGATVYLDGNFDNTGGTLNATNGQFIFRGTNTSAHLDGGTLNIASGAHAYLNGTVTNTGATLNAPTSGTYELYGGTISGGTIATGALTFTNYGGYLSGVSINDNLTLPTYANVRFLGNTTFGGGTMNLGAGSSLYWQQTGTLAGKTLSFANGSYLYVNGTNSTLTLDSASSASGQIQIYSDGSSGTTITNQGTIDHAGSGTGYIYATTLANSGSITNSAANAALVIGSTSSGYNTVNTGNITVNAAGANVYLDGNFDNTGGTLTATNGQFIFRGNNTSAHLDGGTLNIASGAHAYLNGTVTNTGATLNAPTSGTYELYGGTISGGTIATGALTFTNYGGYLDGASLNDNLALPTSSYVRLTNNATFTGSTVTLNANSGLYWQQTGTLSGKTLNFASGSYLDVSGGNNTLALASNSTAAGDIQIYSDGSTGTAITNQGTITHNIAGTGYLYANALANSGSITNAAVNSSLVIGSTSSGYNTTNTGNIAVNATGANVYLDGNFDNTGGILTATNGQFIFRGNNTAAHLNGGTLNIGSGAHAYLNGTLTNTGTTLNAPTSGVYELYGGTITGGTIATGALTFTNYGGYLDGATLADNLTLPNSATVRFMNNAAFTGGNLSLGAYSSVYWQQAGALTGKTLTFGTGSYLYVIGANDTLTLSSNTTGSGDVQISSDGSAGSAITNQGTITHTNTTSSGYIYAPTLVNSGSITNAATNTSLFIGSTSTGYNTTNTGNIAVNATGANIYLDGNVDNTGGTLTATNGQLIFRGTNTTAHLNGGTVNVASGAHAYLNGTITNTGTTLNAPAAGTYELYGGTISGGTIANGALSFTNYGGYLDGASLSGNLTLPTSAYVRLINAAGFTGSTATLGNYASLYWQQAGALAGKSITFGDGSSIYVVGTNDTLTIDPASSASGDVQLYADGSPGTAITNQGTITHTSTTSSGYIYAPTLVNSGSITNAAANTSLFIGSTSTGYNTTNTGNIAVNATGANIYLDGNVDNTGGTLTATNGQLIFRGTNTTAHLNGGTVNVAGGAHAYLNGVLDNTAATLNAPATGSYELYGGTINGGTVGAGALSFTNYAGTLHGVTLLGNLSFPSSTYAYFTGGTNLGTTSSSLTLGSSAGIYWQQAGTLQGNNLSLGASSYLYISGTNAALTLDANSTATGDVSIYSDGSAGTALTIQGNVTHNSGTGYLYANTFTNAGTINVGAGTLYLGTNTTGATVANNAGATIRLVGGNLSLQNPAATPLVNNGTIDIQSGTFFTNGRLSNGLTGAIRGAGTINGDVILSGGTLAPGNSGIGILNFSSGTLTVTGAATFAVDLGGSNADELVFQNPPSVVNLGSGLLTLSLNLLSAPTANMSFPLISISSGGSGISGSFAGLPNTGNTLSASFGGNSYTFAVNYQTNLVSLSYNPIMVPEPSEYALMGLGVLAIAALYWHRRTA